MIEQSHRYTTDQLFAAWADRNRNTPGLYTSEARVPLLEELCEIFSQDNYNVDDILPLRRRVIDVLVSEEGKKVSGKKSHKWGTWLPNTERDFDQVVQSYFVDLDKLEQSFYGDGYLHRKAEIADWVEKTYGTRDESLVRETHRFLGDMIRKFADDILIK